MQLSRKGLILARAEYILPEASAIDPHFLGARSNVPPARVISAWFDALLHDVLASNPGHGHTGTGVVVESPCHFSIRYFQADTCGNLRVWTVATLVAKCGHVAR